MEVDIQTKGSDEFYSNLQLLIASSKRQAMAVANTHFKGVVRNYLAVTPPLGGKNPSFQVDKDGDKTGRVDFDAGLIAGRNAIKSDIKKAFWQMGVDEMTPQKRFKDSVTLSMLNEPATDTLMWYLKMRNKRKRISRAIKRPASKANVDFVIATLYQRQGTLLAGWINAARFFGLSMPSWVRRWGAQRSVFQVETGSDFYYLFAKNTTSFDDADRVARMGEIAMNIQSNNMARILKRYIEDEAKRRGFVTR